MVSINICVPWKVSARKRTTQSIHDRPESYGEGCWISWTPCVEFYGARFRPSSSTSSTRPSRNRQQTKTATQHS